MNTSCAFLINTGKTISISGHVSMYQLKSLIHLKWIACTMLTHKCTHALITEVATYNLFVCVSYSFQMPPEILTGFIITFFL